MKSLQQSKQQQLYLASEAGSEDVIALHRPENPTDRPRLLEEILERDNMERAVKRVIQNKGAPGVGGMNVRKIRRYLDRHWPKIRQALLDGTYAPMSVRRKKIPNRAVSGCSGYRPYWIRRRLRAVIWKHWKNRRTRVGELLKRGISRNYAVTTGCARKGPWRMSKIKWVNIALHDDYFTSLGLMFPWG